MSRAKISAIVLAGGQDNLDLGNNPTNKAHLLIKDKPMAQYVLEVLRASSHIQKTYYVGEKHNAFTPWVDHFVSAGIDLTESLDSGLISASQSDCNYFLIITADLPWLTVEALNDFIQNAPLADLTYVGISKQHSEQQFPDLKRTYVRMRDGQYTGGNLMLLSRQSQNQLVPFVNKAYTARKNPLKLARLAGFRTILGVLSGNLSVMKLERLVSQRMDLDVRIYLSCFASLGADVDTAAHVEQARKPDF